MRGSMHDNTQIHRALPPGLFRAGDTCGTTKKYSAPGSGPRVTSCEGDGI
jgi:hypothetical protein